MMKLQYWLCFYFVVPTLSHEKGFDDTVLFLLNWPGESFEPDPSLKHIVVSTSHEEKYKCYLPNVQEPEVSSVDKYEGPSPLELVAPLFSQNTCLYRLESYWTYELCHGNFIRQYHEDREGKKVKLQEYVLGKWDKNHYQILLDRWNDLSDEEKNISPPTKKVDGINLPYYAVNMENGTLCELNNNKPRETKVMYVCYVHGKHEIYSLKETSTCQYEIVVLSPLLCLHPKYKPQETEENQINCVPLDGSPKKPYNLIKMKHESNKLRRKADVEPIRVEIYPLDLKDKEETVKETTPIDTSPVENFLSGKNCLHGGTGWWKYEFCYGKSVEQYHMERDKTKTSISLGFFDKKKHIEWINAHPNKKPKPVAVRTQLSHFYSGGNVCDKTGKPRQTEVRLKCLENASSSNAVSLYLLEPKYCEYILGVESPLICDILANANEYGLVENIKNDDDDDIPTINFKV
ncbi:endoplasmic reticulum lectin 1 [Onthophagus taurus]|uniref:endoplasmic reticulum lectin 1 n=1 Tax=Onthophagus taurus TaxID=166361 RepID=UPI000C20013F|nr:endoplasmic reticulum lectin 1 [Onthophagus taurus]